MQSLFPTARLRRSDESTSPLPSELVSIDHVFSSGINGQTYSIPQMLNDTYTDALVILRNGIVIHEHYANGMQADSLHLLNSISKTFLGMLTGILVGEGVIDPEERVTTYIHDFTGTAFDQTTVRQLLDMTAAAKFGENYAASSDDFWIETAVLGWRPDLVERVNTNSLKAYATARTETEQVDGSGFHYRTLLTNVLAMVLESAAQSPIQELMERQLWRKLGPEHDANVVVDGTGFPYFGAGMSTSARDLARFGKMLLNDGKVESEQVVPADWIKSTRAGGDNQRAHFAATDYALMLPNWHYQNQTWASESDELLVCIGIFGQTVYVHQASGFVIVKLSTHPEPANDAMYANTFLMMRALVEGLAG